MYDAMQFGCACHGMHRREVCGTRVCSSSPKASNCAVLSIVVDTHHPYTSFLVLSGTQEGEDDDPTTRRGFDGLRNNGMTRGEVTAIRGYFSSQVREVSASLPHRSLHPPPHPSSGKSPTWFIHLGRVSRLAKGHHLACHVTRPSAGVVRRRRRHFPFNCSGGGEGGLYVACPPSRLGELLLPTPVLEYENTQL